ncbi:putative toxin-antitoxin system toxin component, PIN family [soil metagenome]
MIRVVLDANVIVGSFAASSGVLSEIAGAWQSRQFQVVISEHLLGEAQIAWQKPYWVRRYAPDETNRFVAILRRRAEFVVPTPGVSRVATHKEDDLVIATAIAGDADYLVTGDKELLRLRSYKTVAIVSPQEFLEILEAEDAD